MLELVQHPPRDVLPNRRRSETMTFKVGDVVYVATVGYYEDGRIGEVFLNGGKLSSAADIVARDAAIAVSFALQQGVTANRISAAFMRDANGEPQGPLGTLFDLLEGQDD